MQEFFSYVYIVCFTFSVIIFSPYILPHQSQFTAEVKNQWGYTSTPSIRLHRLGRDKSTLFITISDNIPSEKLFPQKTVIS
jgi:hypothetical protein